MGFLDGGTYMEDARGVQEGRKDGNEIAAGPNNVGHGDTVRRFCLRSGANCLFSGRTHFLGGAHIPYRPSAIARPPHSSPWTRPYLSLSASLAYLARLHSHSRPSPSPSFTQQTIHHRYRPPCSPSRARHASPAPGCSLHRQYWCTAQAPLICVVTQANQIPFYQSHIHTVHVLQVQ